MNTHRTNTAQHVTRRTPRRGLFALALAASAATGIAAGDSLAVAEAAPAANPQTATIASVTQGCGQLWDRIVVLGIPEEARASVAEWMGFAQTGDWISADGLTWENIDGRMVAVASPATSDPAESGSSCGTGPDATSNSDRSPA